MKKSTITHFAALALVATALVPPSTARAQDPLCKQLAAAMLKQITVPFHAYTTEVAGFNGNKPELGEMIGTGDAMYISVNGRWRRSPQTPQQLGTLMRQSAMDMKDHSCRKVGSEVVAGVPTVHYHVDVKDPDSPSSTELWIAANGLPMKSETSMDVGGGAAGHSKTSTRYEYSNIHAPAVK